ncbi:hypothetical protein O3M35_000434 [Rhynocoris fuscipes]|uniref:Uncharacterized protein n=1 Tax=Rhynocoris fuscipes TaxID=488301 RepID=A0AAW1DNP1_9HEMI
MVYVANISFCSHIPTHIQTFYTTPISNFIIIFINSSYCRKNICLPLSLSLSL